MRPHIEGRGTRVARPGLVSAFVLAVLCLGSGRASMQSPAAAGPEIRGRRLSAATTGVATTLDLMRAAPRPGDAMPVPRRTRDLQAPRPIEVLAEMTDAPAAISTPIPAETISAPVTAAGSFTAASLFETAAIPPDPSIAVGPAQIIVLANGRIRSFGRTTRVPDGALDLTTNGFFTSVRDGAGTFGGQIRYDRFSDRWIVLMATDAVPARILLAVSGTNAITAATSWTFTSFVNDFPGACAVDAPTLGLDSSALYVGVNQFCGGGTAYAGTSAFVIARGPLASSGSLRATAFHNLTGTVSGAGPFAPHGVDNDDTTAAAGYFLAVDNAAFGRLVLRRVNDPAGPAPTLSADIGIAVAPTAAPIRVRHLGNLGGANGFLDGGDDRIAAAQIRGGRLWAAQTIGVTESGAASTTPTRNAVRWYELQSLDGTPAVVQSGTVFAPAGGASLDERNYWLPSLAVTGQARVVIGSNAAGSTEYVNAAATERLAGDPAGTLRAPSLLTSAAAAYNPAADPGSSSRGRRWGGYTGAVTDACDDMSVWTVQPFADAADSYGLFVARLVAPPPARPVSVSPSQIMAGLSSVDVQVTGLPTDGSGYHQGRAAACHLAASITGLTVNSVTYTSPTSFTLNVSTVTATPGLKAITVTNPDGQSITSSAILSVLPGPIVTLDSPRPGAAGQPLHVQGWAIDGSASTGTGVTEVHVYAQPAGGNAVFIGAAAYGGYREDVAAIYGNRFGHSGFQLTAPMLPAGPYTIAVFARRTVSGAFDSSATVSVTAGGTAAPFGVLDTPLDDVVASGELAITGWALDDAAVARVEILRSPVAGEGDDLIFIGTATFVRGSRTDVQALYPALPNSDTAGWGYMLLTNMLPGQGNGSFTLHAHAVDHAGLRAPLGTRRITAANASATAPFGTIDTPAQGEIVSGTIVNFGWALTPNPKSIPADGSTIEVYIDGIFRGRPVYNNFRADIATLFPGLANSNGAVGYFVIDTTQLSNGLHAIAWVIRDSTGAASGVGSRFFRVQNGS